MSKHRTFNRRRIDVCLEYRHEPKIIKQAEGKHLSYHFTKGYRINQKDRPAVDNVASRLFQKIIAVAEGRAHLQRRQAKVGLGIRAYKKQNDPWAAINYK